MYQMIVTEGPNRGHLFTLQPGENRLGRDPDVDLRVALAKTHQPRDQPSRGEGMQAADRQDAGGVAGIETAHRLIDAIEGIADGRE